MPWSGTFTFPSVPPSQHLALFLVIHALSSSPAVLLLFSCFISTALLFLFFRRPPSLFLLYDFTFLSSILLFSLAISFLISLLRPFLSRYLSQFCYFASHSSFFHFNSHLFIFSLPPSFLLLLISLCVKFFSHQQYYLHLQSTPPSITSV